MVATIAYLNVIFNHTVCDTLLTVKLNDEIISYRQMPLRVKISFFVDKWRV